MQFHCQTFFESYYNFQVVVASIMIFTQSLIRKILTWDLGGSIGSNIHIFPYKWKGTRCVTKQYHIMYTAFIHFITHLAQLGDIGYFTCHKREGQQNLSDSKSVIQAKLNDIWGRTLINHLIHLFIKF